MALFIDVIIEEERFLKWSIEVLEYWSIEEVKLSFATTQSNHPFPAWWASLDLRGNNVYVLPPINNCWERSFLKNLTGQFKIS